MKRNVFIRLPEFEDEDDMRLLKLGSYFLYGSSVRAQKQNKNDGDEICYYQLISKSNIGVEYTPVYDILEKDTKGEKEK